MVPAPAVAPEPDPRPLCPSPSGRAPQPEVATGRGGGRRASRTAEPDRSTTSSCARSLQSLIATLDALPAAPLPEGGLLADAWDAHTLLVRVRDAVDELPSSRGRAPRAAGRRRVGRGREHDERRVRGDAGPHRAVPSRRAGGGGVRAVGEAAASLPSGRGLRARGRRRASCPRRRRYRLVRIVPRGGRRGDQRGQRRRAARGAVGARGGASRVRRGDRRARHADSSGARRARGRRCAPAPRSCSSERRAPTRRPSCARCACRPKTVPRCSTRSPGVLRDNGVEPTGNVAEFARRGVRARPVVVLSTRRRRHPRRHPRRRRPTSRRDSRPAGTAANGDDRVPGS